MRGDAFTKQMRRRIAKLKKLAKASDWQDKHVDGPSGCSDSYDESQRAWSRYREAVHNLMVYLEFKGWL